MRDTIDRHRYLDAIQSGDHGRAALAMLTSVRYACVAPTPLAAPAQPAITDKGVL